METDPRWSRISSHMASTLMEHSRYAAVGSGGSAAMPPPPPPSAPPSAASPSAPPVSVASSRRIHDGSYTGSSSYSLRRRGRLRAASLRARIIARRDAHGELASSASSSAGLPLPAPDPRRRRRCGRCAVRRGRRRRRYLRDEIEAVDADGAGAGVNREEPDAEGTLSIEGDKLRRARRLDAAVRRRKCDAALVDVGDDAPSRHGRELDDDDRRAVAAHSGVSQSRQYRAGARRRRCAKDRRRHRAEATPIHGIPHVEQPAGAERDERISAIEQAPRCPHDGR